MYEDLIKAQAEIEAVTKDAENPFFKSEYATLNATIMACKQALNKNGFAVLQPMDSDENGVYVCTTLIHTSGEKITSKMRIEPSKDDDPQAQGSAITYARRYSLKSLLCMSDNDDDGERAMERKTQPRSQSKGTKQPKNAIDNDLTATCKLHAVEMVQKVSNRTGEPYWSHRMSDGTLCFGRNKK